MDLSVLNPAGQKLFPHLGGLDVHKNAYLAGGTALAFQLQHRRSYDFDFFTQKLPSLDEWRRGLESIGELVVENTHPQGYLGTLNEVQISLSVYRHPLLKKPERFHGTKVALLEDIAPMKLFVLLERTRKRDIYDLYFLAQEFSLVEMLIFFEHKMEGSEISGPVILKALNDLEDVKDEPIELIRDVDWQKVKNFWYNEVRSYVHKYLSDG